MGGAVADGVATGGVAAGHTRETAAPGKSAEGRVSRGVGDFRARSDSVLGGRVEAAGARHRFLNLNRIGAMVVDTQTPASTAVSIEDFSGA